MMIGQWGRAECEADIVLYEEEAENSGGERYMLRVSQYGHGCFYDEYSYQVVSVDVTQRRRHSTVMIMAGRNDSWIDFSTHD